MPDIVLYLLGVVSGGATTAWALALATVLRTPRGGDQ